MPSLVHEQYAAVLKDLERERAETEQKFLVVQEEFGRLHARRVALQELIKALEQRMKAIAPSREIVAPSKTDSASEPSEIVNAPFAHLSMRWAILYLLGEYASEELPNQDIAHLLKDGGFNTGSAEKFRANLNAVLSRMAGHGELEKTELGYRLSGTGKALWQSVKINAKFNARHLLSSRSIFHGGGEGV